MNHNNNTNSHTIYMDRIILITCIFFFIGYAGFRHLRESVQLAVTNKLYMLKAQYEIPRKKIAITIRENDNVNRAILN